jgi:hypothetical protein
VPAIHTTSPCLSPNTAHSRLTLSNRYTRRHFPLPLLAALLQLILCQLLLLLLLLLDVALPAGLTHAPKCTWCC